jgi:glycosyltransferase involved in cell wall biosynthesis
MHIAFITSHYPFKDAKSVGGIGTSIKNLAEELTHLGHNVSVFVYAQEKDHFVIYETISIYKIKNAYLRGFSWYLTRKKIQKKIQEVNQINKIDIVEAPDWEGITSFINLQIPIVLRLNGSDAYFCYLEERRNKFKNKFHEKRALLKADGIISVSDFTAKITQQVFKITKAYTVIPNGVNVEKFKPTSISSDEKIILYFGGIIRKKGLLEIPHYFNIVNQKHPEVKLLLIGKDMPDVSSGNSSTQVMMESLFTEDAIKNVYFLGSKPYNEIKDYINKATICIFPSYAEAMPVSWLEAMALEKAIIGSDIGWSNEIIENGNNGFKVNPKDYTTFASRIIALLDNDELKNNIEKEARITILKTFSTQVTALKTVEYYKKIIGNF